MMAGCFSIWVLVTTEVRLVRSPPPTCALPGICLHESFISIQIANTSLQRQMHVQVRACTHTLLPACVHPGHPRVSRTLAGMWTQMDTVIQRTLFLANNPS